MNDKPSYGPKQIGALVPKLARKAFNARGFLLAEVVTQWRSIIGTKLSEVTLPLSIDFPPGRSNAATLTLRVAPGFGPEVQHLSEVMIERINAFYGYGAVARIKLTQGPMPAREPIRAKRQVRPLTEGEKKHLLAEASGIKDPGLREALARLGQRVLSGSDT